MSVKRISKYECDLCGKTAEAEAHETPKGWVEFDTDGIIDREWINHIVCDTCSEYIVQNKKKK